MTQAKITKQDGFKCAPDGHTVVTFAYGAVVTDKVAEWALASHAASRMFDPRTDTQEEKPALETKKRKKGRGK